MVTIYTIGHSSRELAEFIDILKKYRIHCLADVRRFPTSRKFPHFHRDNLATHLALAKIDYLWLGNALGGFREKKILDSPNTAIKSQGFRNYADYMSTKEFQEGIDLLLDIARQKTTAIMCAEKLYFRCHRFLISDYLTNLNIDVLHIIENGYTRLHRLSRCAEIKNGVLTYDAL